MEANFTLKTKKQLYPFLWPFSERRLNVMFLYQNERLVKCIQRLLCANFRVVEYRYQTNMDAYSLIVAWGLEFEHSLGPIKKVVEAIIPEDYSLGLDTVYEWAVSGKGFDLCEGNVNFHRIAGQNYISFLRWLDNQPRENYREARVGWEALKTFVNLMEVEEELQRAIEDAQALEEAENKDSESRTKKRKRSDPSSSSG
ncbi:hypothetical protein SUGI_0833650 [Cryptomeria japonica]|nr:hypothetical protein SUGI_0833650 [Cryptomeria japonica]